jgi:hypothetical protein
MTHFETFSAEEIDLLTQAPAWVTVLVAGADQQISDRETAWATKLVNYRTFTAPEELQPYYEAVANRFEADLVGLTEDWTPAAADALIADLADLKPLIERLEPKIAELLKTSWRSLAQRVAEAEGGLLGFGKTSMAERAVVELSMLD